MKFTMKEEGRKGAKKEMEKKEGKRGMQGKEESSVLYYLRNSYTVQVSALHKL